MQQFKLDTYSRFMYRGSLIGKIFANFEQFPHKQKGRFTERCPCCLFIPLLVSLKWDFILSSICVDLTLCVEAPPPHFFFLFFFFPAVRFVP